MHAHIEPADYFHLKIAFPAFLKLSYSTAEAMYAWLTAREMYTFRRRAFGCTCSLTHIFHSFTQPVHLIPNSTVEDGETISDILHLFQCLIP